MNEFSVFNGPEVCFAVTNAALSSCITGAFFVPFVALAGTACCCNLILSAKYCSVTFGNSGCQSMCTIQAMRLTRTTCAITSAAWQLALLGQLLPIFVHDASLHENALLLLLMSCKQRLCFWGSMCTASAAGVMQITMHKDNLHHGGVEHRDLHNLNGALVHMATAQGLEERGRAIFGSDGDRPFVLSRSFFAGSQRTGPIWTGDNAASWEHLRLSLPMLLSISVAGLPFAGMLLSIMVASLTFAASAAVHEWYWHPFCWCAKHL